MNIISDEIIEAGARAIADSEWLAELDCVYTWEGLPAWVKHKYRTRATACLTASLPGVLEACAEAAEGIPTIGGDDYSAGLDRGRERAAEAVRALSPHSVNQEGK